jgi:hypothetical protein
MHVPLLEHSEKQKVFRLLVDGIVEEYTLRQLRVS